jgi:hypothetical protein
MENGSVSGRRVCALESVGLTKNSTDGENKTTKQAGEDGQPAEWNENQNQTEWITIWIMVTRPPERTNESNVGFLHTSECLGMIFCFVWLVVWE